ncbi:MAG TPA: hypothetical protein VH170_05300 [Chthoniobacterales bacterium]|nr:hypothetical protein [Chthoniobacterales bacterium]
MQTPATSAEPEEGLWARICKRLESHPFCTVFESDLAIVWPYVDKERQKRFSKINEFAAAHGCTATIHDPGIRVIFRQVRSKAKRERASVAA